ncbi:hypothetical protein FNV43_RR17535 [Rhamnella rubrinervis]|uniref:Phospho-2-dehydro-3-deoxyheptonate aldolase n=1 Tax=Rhamnella rubrinervis TaxID=2594499 RepID=A0A8K0E3W5_9ROSA|nr:hypothetical protein FNV43_RR17535 [Rhamnella rubrinervis]
MSVCIWHMSKHSQGKIQLLDSTMIALLTCFGLVGDKMDPKEQVKLVDILTSKMGAEKTRVKLPHLIRAVRQAGHFVAWGKVGAVFDVHEEEGSHAEGIHLEMTRQNVTERIGGSGAVTVDDLSSRYRTL